MTAVITRALLKIPAWSERDHRLRDLELKQVEGELAGVHSETVLLRSAAFWAIVFIPLAVLAGILDAVGLAEHGWHRELILVVLAMPLAAVPWFLVRHLFRSARSAPQGWDDAVIMGLAVLISRLL